MEFFKDLEAYGSLALIKPNALSGFILHPIKLSSFMDTNAVFMSQIDELVMFNYRI